ncbi:hypothetical protein L3Q82_003418 [Scortum barcoo]|uniref:Uncharacterized protein n=1 Tax=Scortum barcoo TaxID=214431 RepID=A0ACB8VPC5_9TELE|nr:hypothetical protein L3Q82_003418 [Scortum barcoo]
MLSLHSLRRKKNQKNRCLADFVTVCVMSPSQIIADVNPEEPEAADSPHCNPIDGEESAEERNYNVYHCQACAVVEHTIGLLKGRWRCLACLDASGGKLSYRPEKSQEQSLFDRHEFELELDLVQRFERGFSQRA